MISHCVDVTPARLSLHMEDPRARPERTAPHPMPWRGDLTLVNPNVDALRGRAKVGELGAFFPHTASTSALKLQLVMIATHYSGAAHFRCGWQGV